MLNTFTPLQPSNASSNVVHSTMIPSNSSSAQVNNSGSNPFNNDMSIDEFLKIAREYDDYNFKQQSDFNKKMYEEAAKFNATQAQLDRDFQEKMSNTQYQRAVKDLEKAGLNKLLAYSNLNGSSPSGSTASISPTSASRSSSINSSVAGMSNTAQNNITRLFGYALSAITDFIGSIIKGFASFTG